MKKNLSSVELLIDWSNAQGFLHDLDLDLIRSKYAVEMHHAWLIVELQHKFDEIVKQGNFDPNKFSLHITITEKK